MKGLWNDVDAACWEGDLGQRVYTSRLLGREPSLVLHGGGNTSVKLREPDAFGTPRDVLYVKGSGWDLATIEAAGFAPVLMDHLLRLARLEQLADERMVNELATHVTRAGAPAPSVEAILHALLPHRFVDHTHADALLAVSDTADGAARVREIYGDTVVVVPYVMPGFDLARACAREFPRQAHAGTVGMVLLNHGLFSFGATARESYERMIDLVTRAEDYLRRHAPRAAANPQYRDPPDRVAVARLRRALGCSEDALRDTQALIRTLDPRPGAAYARSETRYVVPDIFVRKVRGEWVAGLNPDAMPRLRINQMYSAMLQGMRGSARGGLSAQLQEARALIKNVQQRYDTIQRIAQAIVDRQRHFLEHGEVGMRPLVLREIADVLGCVESTVSRGTNGKYMATPRGIFELKYFFSSHVSTDTGGACSATAIRALIRQLVGAEDAHEPLSDSRIAELLGQQGIVVARRTIAKYRESLQIPPVNLRKAL